MTNTTRKALSELGAIIRGYFYDGESSIIVNSQKMDKGDIILDPSILSLDDFEKAIVLRNTIDEFVKKENRLSFYNPY